MIYLSVVIPAYNEANRIQGTLTRIWNYLSVRGLDFEIIVVDDGSRDRTGELVDKNRADIPSLKLIRFERNQGKGWAVREGMLCAEGEFILMTDADLSTPIEELEKMERAIRDGYDIAIGSRRLAGARIIKRQPWLRERIGVAFGFLTGLIVRTGFADTQCGFKFFKREVARKLFSLQTIKGLPFDLEILALAKKFGFRIIEVPVDWLDAEGSKVKPIVHLPRVIREVLKIRYNLWRGKYIEKG